MKSKALTLISKLLPLANVALDLDVTSKKRVFEQAGCCSRTTQQIPPQARCSTACSRGRSSARPVSGQGVAIPHGRIKGLKEAVGAFLRLTAPVPFDAPDGKPVNLMFVLLVPEQATDLHLQILSELAQMFSDKAMREHLLDGRERRSCAQAHHRVGAPCPRSA